MRHAWALALFIAPYSLMVPQSPGNPNGQPYAGQPGSTYDQAANPPKTAGVVTYDPYAQLPPQAGAPVSAPVTAPGAMPPPSPQPPRQSRQ